MDYIHLKTIHVACVVLTFLFFAGRGVLSFMSSPLLRMRFFRVAPHVIDTLLLGTAVWMAASSHQYPFVESWLTAKLLALIVYIGAGMIALSARHAIRVRIAAWLFALATFGYIVSVALTRNPAPFM
jgi:uncharacterized membrane protein SirB2